MRRLWTHPLTTGVALGSMLSLCLHGVLHPRPAAAAPAPLATPAASLAPAAAVTNAALAQQPGLPLEAPAGNLDPAGPTWEQTMDYLWQTVLQRDRGANESVFEFFDLPTDTGMYTAVVGSVTDATEFVSVEFVLNEQTVPTAEQVDRGLRTAFTDVALPNFAGSAMDAETADALLAEMELEYMLAQPEFRTAVAVISWDGDDWRRAVPVVGTLTRMWPGTADEVVRFDVGSSVPWGVIYAFDLEESGLFDSGRVDIENAGGLLPSCRPGRPPLTDGEFFEWPDPSDYLPDEVSQLLANVPCISAEGICLCDFLEQPGPGQRTGSRCDLGELGEVLAICTGIFAATMAICTAAFGAAIAAALIACGKFAAPKFAKCMSLAKKAAFATLGLCAAAAAAALGACLVTFADDLREACFGGGQNPPVTAPPPAPGVPPAPIPVPAPPPPGDGPSPF